MSRLTHNSIPQIIAMCQMLKYQRVWLYDTVGASWMRLVILYNKLVRWIPLDKEANWSQLYS